MTDEELVKEFRALELQLRYDAEQLSLIGDLRTFMSRYNSRKSIARRTEIRAKLAIADRIQRIFLGSKL